jgi:glycerol-3-phosphate dehydrogenase subunit C
MTTTYDPFHPKYFDEADLRQEMNRVYDLCHGCRLCFKFCTAFPSLFEAIDQHDDQDASKMTEAEQDKVVDECFNCKLCYVNCPYIPGQHEWELDFPRLMLRAEQVVHRNRRRGLAGLMTDNALGRTDLAGKVNTTLAPVVNKVVEKPGGVGRNLMQKVTGIASERVLPPYARQRFSTWWRKRKHTAAGRNGSKQGTQGRAIVFPTCIVEYQAPQVGKDLVRVFERNGIECDLPEGQVCCGAPWLHEGDVDNFRKQGAKNVALLAGAIREAQARGDDPAVVVPQPTCGYVLKHDYRDYIGGEDADLVAEHTYDSSEYLMAQHKQQPLDTEFGGQTYESILWQAACHYRAQQIGPKSRDLMALTGAKVAMVERCSAIDGTWGLRAENVEMARKVAKPLMEKVSESDADLVAGDCQLSNTAIFEATAKQPVHPLQVLARAYGIEEE